MNLIDRSTRDRVSRFVWGGLAVVCLVMFLLGRVAENRSFARTLDDAEARSLSYANLAVAPYAEMRGDPPELRFFYREVSTTLQAEVFTDGSVGRVRVWAPDGTLLYSSDDPRLAGQVRATDVPGIDAAIAGRSTRQTVVEPFTYSTVGTTPVDTELLQVYSPLRAPDRIGPAGAVEVDFLMSALRGEARGAWPTFRLLFGTLFLIFAAMFAMAMRPAASLVGAGVDAATDGSSTTDPVIPSRVKRLAPAHAAGVTRQEKKLEARVKRLETALVAAEERSASLEAQIATTANVHAGVAAAAEQERSALRQQLDDVTARATASEAALVAATADLEAAKAAADRRSDLDRAAAVDREPEPEPEVAEAGPQAAPEPQPEPSPALAEDDEDPLAALEASLAAAERRAGDTRERLTEVAPDAADLRARLARTAAQKKGIASVPDGG